MDLAIGSGDDATVKRWSVAISASLWAAVLAGPGPASAWCRSTTQSGSVAGCDTEGVPLSWRQRCIEYAVDARGGRDITADELSAIQRRAFARWTDLECPLTGGPVGLEIQEHAERALCDEARFDTGGPNVNVVAFVEDWDARELDPGAYALTIQSYSLSSGEIFDMDILINDQRGPYADCVTTGCTGAEVDLESALTHEAGHFVGLSHSEESSAVMWLRLERGEVRRDIQADDREGFCSIYPPGSLRGECTFATCGGLALECDGPPSEAGRVSPACFGGGGCGCHTTSPASPKGVLPLALLALLGLARRRCTRN